MEAPIVARMIRPLIATLLLLSVAPAAHAQESVIQLSPEQREKALNAAADKALGEPAINGLPGRQIHGEVGMAIGTGGMRSVYGTVIAPLGDTGSASFSYENSRFNDRYYGRRGTAY